MIHHEADIKIRVKRDSWYDAVEFAKLLRDVSTFEARDCLLIARMMLKGETWRPEPHQLRVDPRTVPAFNFLDIDITEPVDPYEARRQKAAADWAKLEAAAAGDATAAVEFCKGLLDHRYTYLFQASAG